MGCYRWSAGLMWSSTPVIGLRLEADGYETWVRFLNDIAPDDGRRLDNLVPMPITVRLNPLDHRDWP
jgi:hypothetical protein